jgi:predicted glycoside hydrolase/deacetylase ChbG (UPF0249 family)
MQHLIFNADDFGASTGINNGIVECHVGGVVTSASLMVTGRAAAEAAALARAHPALSVGLHWDVWGEDERTFDLRDLQAVRDEFRRQVDEFVRLLGRLPTHVDSHQHAHRKKSAAALLRELTHELGLPLREDGSVRHRGGFYGQWEWQVTDLEHIGVPFLQWMLRNEVRAGWNEFACHPGRVTPDFRSVYLHEREVEIRTLTDPAIPATLRELGIELASYHDYHRARAAAARPYS